MTSSTFSIAESTSDLANRFSKAIEKNEQLRTAEQLKTLHAKMELIRDLGQRGLLNRQEFVAEPSADTFEKIYSSTLAKF